MILTSLFSSPSWVYSHHHLSPTNETQVFLSVEANFLLTHSVGITRAACTATLSMPLVTSPHRSEDLFQETNIYSVNIKQEVFNFSMFLFQILDKT